MVAPSWSGTTSFNELPTATVEVPLRRLLVVDEIRPIADARSLILGISDRESSWPPRGLEGGMVRGKILALLSCRWTSLTGSQAAVANDLVALLGRCSKIDSVQTALDRESGTAVSYVLNLCSHEDFALASRPRMVPIIA